MGDHYAALQKKKPAPTCTMFGWFMMLLIAASMMAMRSRFSAPDILAGSTMVLMATVLPRHTPSAQHSTACSTIGMTQPHAHGVQQSASRGLLFVTVHCCFYGCLILPTLSLCCIRLFILSALCRSPSRSIAPPAVPALAHVCS